MLCDRPNVIFFADDSDHGDVLGYIDLITIGLTVKRPNVYQLL